VIPVTLASQSAARKALLTAAGVSFTAVSPGVDEDLVKAELARYPVRDIALALADAKALAVTAPGLIIGADQTLEFEHGLYDKAADIDEARDRLLLMRGKTHELHSAVAVARDGAVIWKERVTAALTMRNFGDAFLASYLAANRDAVLSSVGGYQLEGAGLQLFDKIEGDYFAILGLPMLGLLDLLRREGALAS
jgi:septum formation protein